MRHFEFTDEKMNFRGRVLRRIRAVKDFGSVEAGTLGGWIEIEDNLKGFGWVSDEAKVFGNAVVGDFAVVCNEAVVKDDAVICDCASVENLAVVFQNAVIAGGCTIGGHALVGGEVYLDGNIHIFNESVFLGRYSLCGNFSVYEKAHINSFDDYCLFSGFGSRGGTTFAYRVSDGRVYVSCGCFHGRLRFFEYMVHDTHGNSCYGMEYQKVIELIKMKFGLDK